jgi:hypothetical protein
MLMEDGTVRYTGDLVRGTLVVEKVGPFMAAFRARYTMNFRLVFTPHMSVCFSTSDSAVKIFLQTTSLGQSPFTEANN